MADNMSNIPEPSQDAQLAWLRAGSGNYKLVYVNDTWKIVANGQVPAGAITWQKVTAGKKAEKDAARAAKYPTTSPKLGVSPADVYDTSTKDVLFKYVNKLDLVADTAAGEVTGLPTDDKGNVIKGNRVPYFLYVSPTGLPTVTSSYGELRKKIFADYQTAPGGMDKLFTLLHNKKLISDATFNSKDFSAQDFDKGLQYAVNRAMVDAVDKRAVANKLDMPTLDGFLSGNSIPSVGTGTGPTTSISKHETLRQDADKEADAFFMSMLGQHATQKQKDDYFNTLHKAEKNAAVKRTSSNGTSVDVSVETGAFISDTDKSLMLGKIAGSALAGTNIDTILKGGAGAAQDINKLRTYANGYGIRLSNEEAMAYVADNLKTGQDLNSKKAKIQKLSKIKYANLADSIDDSTSVADIASDARYTLSKLTGMPVATIDLNHPVMQKILSNNGKKGVMTQAESEYLIKTDPATKQQWLNSPDAKEQAAGFALNILRTFGLMS